MLIIYKIVCVCVGGGGGCGWVRLVEYTLKDIVRLNSECVENNAKRATALKCSVVVTDWFVLSNLNFNSKLMTGLQHVHLQNI